jgi:hypothetical protein
MTFRLLILLMVLFTQIPGSLAADTLAFQCLKLRAYPPVQLFIPRVQNADRLYVLSRYNSEPVAVHLKIDDTQLVRPLGTAQTTSMPPQLLQEYGKRFTAITAFPVAPLKGAHHSVELGFALESGREKRITISGKHLQNLLNRLP